MVTESDVLLAKASKAVIIGFHVQVNSNVKLSLKTIVLLPILKAEYNVFVSNVFKKMAKNAKEIKI